MAGGGARVAVAWARVLVVVRGAAPPLLLWEGEAVWGGEAESSPNSLSLFDCGGRGGFVSSLHQVTIVPV